VGVDISQNLLKIVKNKIQKIGINNVSLIHADMIRLPIEDYSFDSILCIASIHNIKSRNQRILALKEIYRILNKKGTALISVWSRWQDKYRIYFLKRIFNSKDEFGDIEIYWKQDNLNVPRFYHLYSQRELKNDLLHAGFKINKIWGVKLKSNKYPDNFFAIVEKE
jgi:ubiquinone/menaquinone biosynthesis C-methylase UbiE